MPDPTIYLNFDNNRNILPGDIAPTDIGASSLIDTTKSKFGRASRKDSGVGNATKWSGLTSSFTNEGTLGCWFYATSGITSIVATITFFDADVGGNVILQLKVFWNGSNRALDANFLKAGVNVNGAQSPVSFDDSFHLLEINWTSNDVGGNAELSYDGIVKTTSQGLDAIDVSDTIRRMEVVTDTDPNQEIWIDEITYYTTRQHFGNFSPPTVPAIIESVMVESQTSLVEDEVEIISKNCYQIVEIYKLTLNDGRELFFTSDNANANWLNDTYVAFPINRSRTSQGVDQSVQEISITMGDKDNALAREILQNLDNVEDAVFTVWQSLETNTGKDSHGFRQIFKGKIKSISGSFGAIINFTVTESYADPQKPLVNKKFGEIEGVADAHKLLRR